MTFKEYLKSKKNLIIIYLCFNLFALFVSGFGIEGVIQKGDRNCMNCREIPVIHIFTDNYNQFTINSQNKFWPFSGITNSILIEHNSYGSYVHDTNLFKPIPENCNKIIDFFGIFYMYDMSEFIAYIFLLFIVLYFRWENKRKKQ
jgi:hypothetical protein